MRPRITLVKVTRVPSTAPTPPAAGAGTSGDFVVELKVRDLIAFGESTVPLLYRGKEVESLRFSKPGLIAKAVGEGGFVAREGETRLFSRKRRTAWLPLVLENTSAFEYKSVRARLRFANTDVCGFETEKFAGSPAAKSSTSCDKFEEWTAFDIPSYAQVTLRAEPNPAWFRDPKTNLARSGKEKGWLTVRFQSAAGGPIYEQNLPLEVQFEPSGFSIFTSLLCIGGFLALGAFLSLVLRVALPNSKRKRNLKDQLEDAANLIGTISSETDSNLRVLLRVERLALDEIRKSEWAVFPSYADVAQSIEEKLPLLKRRIEACKRLDGALLRRKVMLEQGAAPSRLAQIEDLVDSISQILMQDQLSDEDWVAVSQRLDTALKALREPTQVEKEAFEAMLSARWKTIREHFKNGDTLQLPPSLKGMEICLPEASLLPKGEEAKEWIQAVGPVRADLQLSALMLLLDFEFLAPAAGADAEPRWIKGKNAIKELLATPTIENLREARLLLRQLAEDVTGEDIVEAVKNNNAFIDVDPSLLRPNRKIKFSIRFRTFKLNYAAARDLVTCHWQFKDLHRSRSQRFLLGLTALKRRLAGTPQPDELDDACSSDTQFKEEGWDVHHYYESDVFKSIISVSFDDQHGKPVDLGEPTPASWFKRVECIRQSRRNKEKWARTWLEASQLAAALLVPLAALASTTLNGGSVGQWWELVVLGFGSDTIKNILVSRQ
jgi:hypothetical protein